METAVRGSGADSASRDELCPYMCYNWVGAHIDGVGPLRARSTYPARAHSEIGALGAWEWRLAL